MPLHPLTGKPCSKGEFDSVSAQLKKEAKMAKASKAAVFTSAPAAAGGGAGGGAAEPVKKSAAGKSRADLANEANLEQLIKNVSTLEYTPGLLSYFIHNASFYKVTSMDGGKVTAVRRSLTVRPSGKVEEFLANNPGARVEEVTEWERVHKIDAHPRFTTYSRTAAEKEISYMEKQEFELTADLLKDNGKSGVRILQVGSIVAVRMETGQQLMKYYKKTPQGQIFVEEMVGVSHQKVFCTVPEEFTELLELEGKLE